MSGHGDSPARKALKICQQDERDTLAARHDFELRELTRSAQVTRGRAAAKVKAELSALKWTPVAPLRDAVLEQIDADELTYNDLARRLWGKGDSSRIKRMLGVMDRQSGCVPRKAVRIKYTNAEKIARAAGIDPVDIGL